MTCIISNNSTEEFSHDREQTVVHKCTQVQGIGKPLLMWHHGMHFEHVQTAITRAGVQEISKSNWNVPPTSFNLEHTINLGHLASIAHQNQPFSNCEHSPLPSNINNSTVYRRRIFLWFVTITVTLNRIFASVVLNARQTLNAKLFDEEWTALVPAKCSSVLYY